MSCRLLLIAILSVVDATIAQRLKRMQVKHRDTLQEMETRMANAASKMTVVTERVHNQLREALQKMFTVKEIAAVSQEYDVDEYLSANVIPDLVTLASVDSRCERVLKLLGYPKFTADYDLNAALEELQDIIAGSSV